MKVHFKTLRKVSLTYTSKSVCNVEYLCQGQWQENSTTFIVAKHVGSSHGVCITFKQNLDGQTGNFIVGDSCFRSTLTQLTPSDRHLVSNITSFGKSFTQKFQSQIPLKNETLLGTCSDTSSSTTPHISLLTILLCTFVSSYIFNMKR